MKDHWRWQERVGVGWWRTMPLEGRGAGAVFASRRGGVRPSPYDTLNQGGSGGDDSRRVVENLARFARVTGFAVEPGAWARQVHGAAVSVVQAPGDRNHGASPRLQAWAEPSRSGALAVRRPCMRQPHKVNMRMVPRSSGPPSRPPLFLSARRATLRSHAVRDLDAVAAGAKRRGTCARPCGRGGVPPRGSPGAGRRWAGPCVDGDDACCRW